MMGTAPFTDKDSRISIALLSFGVGRNTVADLQTHFSASPLQRDRPAHRMLHFCSGSFRFEVRGLERKVPLRRTIGIIDQHQMWIMLQTFALQFHGSPVLFDEFCEDKFQ